MKIKTLYDSAGGATMNAFDWGRNQRRLSRCYRRTALSVTSLLLLLLPPPVAPYSGDGRQVFNDLLTTSRCHRCRAAQHLYSSSAKWQWMVIIWQRVLICVDVIKLVISIVLCCVVFIYYFIYLGLYSTYLIRRLLDKVEVARACVRACVQKDREVRARDFGFVKGLTYLIRRLVDKVKVVQWTDRQTDRQCTTLAYIAWNNNKYWSYQM